EPEFSRCRDNQLFHPGVAASIAIGNTAVGFVGRLHPLIEENFGFNGDVYLALLDVDQLWSDFRPKKVYRPIARTMTAGRDLSFTLDRGSTAAGIIAAVRAAGGEDLLAADIFDVYQGENVAAGKKSVAVGMTFATADVADSATGRIIRRLEEEFGAIIRR
ncbi:MAG: hypothetical protein N3A57_07790, partial [Negativicutes bacterium]|nr:hypothetical protein [Negativicutes bacterium]